MKDNNDTPGGAGKVLQAPFHLVQNGLSSDTAKTLQNLLDEAQRGELIGMAFVAMYRRREYAANATGEARRNPTFARGMVQALNDFLGDMVSR